MSRRLLLQGRMGDICYGCNTVAPRSGSLYWHAAFPAHLSRVAARRVWTSPRLQRRPEKAVTPGLLDPERSRAWSIAVLELAWTLGDLRCRTTIGCAIDFRRVLFDAVYTSGTSSPATKWKAYKGYVTKTLWTMSWPVEGTRGLEGERDRRGGGRRGGGKGAC